MYNGQPAAGPTREEFCSSVCTKATTCGLPTTNCMQNCIYSPASVSCVTAAANDCNAFSSCVLAASCNGAPRGGLTCSQAFTCMVGCGTAPNPMACGCQCGTQMSPAHATILLRLDMCIFRCKFESGCIQQNCAPQVQACLGQ